MEMWGVSLLGEESIDKRVQSDANGGWSQEAEAKGAGLGLGAGAEAKGAGLGLGAGAGAGAGAGTITFASAGNKIGTANGHTAVQKSLVNAVETAQSQSAQSAAGAKDKQPLATRSWFSALRLTFSFAFVVKALCMMCNIFYQASPLPLITGFQAKGDTGDSDIAPFIATCYGGWQWCFYGLFAYEVTQKSGFLVLVYSNVVGATLGLYYVWAFNANCKNVAMIQRSVRYYGVLASIVLIQLLLICTMQPVRALFFSGLISSVWSTVASLSLISTVPTVFERKTCASLPLPLLVVGIVSAALWILCGVILWDPWISFPNMFSFVVCTFALYLCWLFPKDGPQSLDKLEVDGAEAGEMPDEGEFRDVRESPFQRAMLFVGASTASEAQPLQDQVAMSRKYGTTGGTGDW